MPTVYANRRFYLCVMIARNLQGGEEKRRVVHGRRLSYPGTGVLLTSKQPFQGGKKMKDIGHRTWTMMLTFVYEILTGKMVVVLDRVGKPETFACRDRCV